jgi:hypothetical protein
MYSDVGDQALPWPGCPIRKSPDQSLLAAPRSVSPLVASFIGLMPLGIRRTLLVAYSRILREDLVPKLLHYATVNVLSRIFQRHHRPTWD